MKLYLPVTYARAEALRYTVSVLEGVVPAGSIVLNHERTAMLTMDRLGACLVLDPAPDCYERTSLANWCRLLEEVPVVELRIKDLDQHLVDVAEQRILGLPEPKEPNVQFVKPLVRPTFKPADEALRKFRVQNGRSPNDSELRKMSGWRR